MKTEKIGLALLTYDREDIFFEVLKNIPFQNIDEFVIINDGKGYKKILGSPSYYIQHKENIGIGRSKNEALKYLLDKGCTHLFLLEDDIRIKNSEVFNEYIKAYKESKIPHFCFENRPVNEGALKLVVNYKNNIKIGLYRDLGGSFTYFHKNCIEKYGYIHEEYKNLLEHIDYYYYLDKQGVLPQFWWFCDVLNSDNFLENIKTPSSINHSNDSIEEAEKFNRLYELNANIFIKRWGHFINKIQNVDKEEVIERLKNIKNMP